MKKYYLAFILSLILSLFSQSDVYGDESNIHIYSDINGKTEVLIRPCKTGEYRKAADALPAIIPVEKNRNYDILIIKYVSFIYRYRGEKKEVNSGSTITITTYREIASERVIIIIALPFLLIMELNRRKKAKKARLLEDKLKIAETVAEEAERRIEKTSLEVKIPEKIGHYKILEKLGEGGMAVVFKSQDEYGDIFALKVPNARFLNDPEFLKRFFHEINIGKSLNSPYIVKMYDSNINPDEGVPFICLEFVEGETLSSLMKREHRMDYSRILKFIRQMAEALKHAHSRGIVHRDVKPGNIMITPQYDIKIMDFGVAKANDLSAVTATDAMLGTPSYMAPEQIDSKEADSRADLYSVGVIFYELVTDQLPFTDPDPIKIVMKKLTLKPPAPSEIRDSVPADMETIIMKLVEKDIKLRYQSSEELLQDLENLSAKLKQ